jgi:hypothetical protein
MNLLSVSYRKVCSAMPQLRNRKVNERVSYRKVCSAMPQLRNRKVNEKTPFNHDKLFEFEKIKF